jgi:hypothetical protein
MADGKALPMVIKRWRRCQAFALRLEGTLPGLSRAPAGGRVHIALDAPGLVHGKGTMPFKNNEGVRLPGSHRQQ